MHISFGYVETLLPNMPLLLLSLLILCFVLYFKNTIKYLFYDGLFYTYVYSITIISIPIMLWRGRNPYNCTQLWIRFTLLSKKKNFPIWPINAIAKNICGVTLINNDGTTDNEIREDLKEMAQLAIQRKAKIMIYPEGTRNSSSKLLPFKKGAFRIAIENQMPIIPIVISPFYFISWEKRIFDKGLVIVDVLEPVSTSGLTLEDMDELIDKVHCTMSEKYAQLREEVLQQSN